MLVDDVVEVEGRHVAVTIAPDGGGVVEEFDLLNTPGGLAGAEGLLKEGFGVGSDYVPNRRLNERLEILDEAERPIIIYSYDCNGPNIEGLHVTRRMEPLPDEASMRVTWTVENRGEEAQWIAPWVENDVAPGGKVSAGDRLDLPVFAGILAAGETAFHPAARNWAAATDPIEQETFYAVFHADQTHSFLAERSRERGRCGFLTAFVPRFLDAGATWETVYRLNAVRGLTHVDFASSELAAQMEYDEGKLTVLLSAARAMPDHNIRARVLAPNGRVWRLPDKKFSLAPGHLARCTYAWMPPGPGKYEFLAQLSHRGEPVALGADTGSPHGGIDTQFVVGDPEDTTFAPWTNAPYALERGSRVLERTLAAAGEIQVWFEPGTHKVFPEDRPEPAGDIDPAVHIALAGNEYEAFQIAVRPPEGRDLDNLRLVAHELTRKNGEGRIPVENIRLHNVAYHPVRIPSNYEGPTGAWPDALPEHTPFTAKGGETRPVWVSIYAPPELPAGVYLGMLELQAGNMEPLELWVEAQVFGFSLPATPALKTDFGFWREAAVRGARQRGGNPAPERLEAAYLENALAHRVTLRAPTRFPRESARYADDLSAYAKRLEPWLSTGATTLAVPPSLLDAPEQLQRANAFVEEHDLESRAFVHLAHEPEEPAWPRLLETMQRWKDLAPSIPIMVTTGGLTPFIPDVLDRWAVHAPVFDTTHNKRVLEHIAGGNETWWYVDDAPARPYPNLLLDFAAMEHRILFWQAWALGLAGMHYWSVNFSPPGKDPWKDQLDITPVNGNGCLVYPGKDGPVDSIRWACVRDGIEDYDYLALLAEYRRRLARKGGHEGLLARIEAAFQLDPVLTSLVSYTREPAVLLAKRREIGEALTAARRTLGR